MTVRIECKKIVDPVKGKMYQINKIEGVAKREELPQFYFNKPPYFYKVGAETVFLYDCNRIRREISAGDKLTEKEARGIIESLEIAGERLATIKKEFKLLEREWQGTYTVII